MWTCQEYIGSQLDHIKLAHRKQRWQITKHDSLPEFVTNATLKAFGGSPMLLSPLAVWTSTAARTVGDRSPSLKKRNAEPRFGQGCTA